MMGAATTSCCAGWGLPVATAAAAGADGVALPSRLEIIMTLNKIFRLISETSHALVHPRAGSRAGEGDAGAA